jgi:hypothetical protein
MNVVDDGDISNAGDDNGKNAEDDGENIAVDDDDGGDNRRWTGITIES